MERGEWRVESEVGRRGRAPQYVDSIHYTVFAPRCKARAPLLRYGKIRLLFTRNKQKIY